MSEEITEAIVPPTKKEMYKALKALFSNKYLALGDLVYQVRDSELAGWDGKWVTHWGEAVDRAEKVIAQYEAAKK